MQLNKSKKKEGIKKSEPEYMAQQPGQGFRFLDPLIIFMPS
jgi:hypothetical protein